MSSAAFAGSDPADPDNDAVNIEASGPYEPVLAAVFHSAVQPSLAQFNQVWQNEALWENVDQDKVLTTMANAILGLRISNGQMAGGVDSEESSAEDSDTSAEDEGSSDEDDSDGDDDDMIDTNDPNAPVGITLRISNDFTISDLERLRVSAYDALTGLVVMVNQRNKSDPRALTEKEAHTITMVFSKIWLELPLATLLSDDEDVPGVLRRVFSNIAALKFGAGGMNTIQSLKYHLALVEFNTNWEYTKDCITQGNEEGREILRYIQPPGRGVRRVSHAKAVICRKLSITSQKFDSLYKSSHIAAAMVATFGKGAVMFLPNGTNGNRGKIPYLSAVSQIFMTIRGTDESKVLRRIARKLDSTILRHIRNKRVLPWDTDVKQIPNQPLETVLEGLMP
ncbi:hypothetical protein MFIFM68171_03090 [Madurella fahalii]|uniref:Uncharacterized protein n=1 Tax=Madurella fahalii TaxID=1157608 RepID=A0ABQ0G563_9PEZI